LQLKAGRSGACAAIACAAAFLAGCASVPPAVDGIAATEWALASRFAPGKLVPPPRWEHMPLPGKAQVRFVGVHNDDRAALSATAESAASVVRQRVRIEPDELGRLRFSWKVPQLIDTADLATREADDAPVRIILAFEGDRSRFSAKDALLSELMRALMGEEMPYATLMYVWCNKRPPGSVVRSPRTDRIRKLVLESGPGRLGQWIDYDRDLRADFQRTFGEPPGALIGIAVMTDSDNTRSTTRALYGPLRHVSPAAHDGR
jgi:Protein of unknown function (DUF3047)